MHNGTLRDIKCIISRRLYICICTEDEQYSYLRIFLYCIYTIEYLEWPCTVNSRLASWTIPDLFLSREKYRCRAEIDHFANQLLNLQGFISVVYVWGVSHCLKCNIYSQFSLLSMNLLVCSSPRYNMGKYYFLGFLV